MYVERHYTLLFSVFFFKKGKNEKNHNFWEKPWNNSFEKRQIVPLSLIDVFYGLESLFLYIEWHQKLLFGIFSLKRKNEKIKIFEKNHGLSPSEKCKFCDFFKSMFL